MPDDEFELLLERCRENLSEISLRVPNLEIGPPRHLPIVYTLTSPPEAAPNPAAPPPPPKLPEPKWEPAAEEAPVREPDAVIAPPLPAPMPEAAEEEEVFPPLVVRPRTPPPSIPLWRTQPDSAPTPEPEPERPPARGRRAAAASAVVAAGAFGVWLARRPAPDLDIPIDAADAMAVRPEKGDVLVAEGKELVDISRDGRILGRRPQDAPVDSLSWVPGSLWSADGRTATVVEHADDGRATVFTLNHVPVAIEVKDKYLWTAEKDGRLHEYLISRSILGALLQPIDSFELSGLSPAAFAIDDAGTLWVADELTRHLTRFRLENGSYKPVSWAPLSPFLGPEGKLRDLTVDGSAVWILAQPENGPRASLRRILLSHLDWTPV